MSDLIDRLKSSISEYAYIDEDEYPEAHKAITNAIAELTRLRASNAELLAACQEMLAMIATADEFDWLPTGDAKTIDAAKAAIARAQEAPR